MSSLIFFDVFSCIIVLYNIHLINTQGVKLNEKEKNE